MENWEQAPVDAKLRAALHLMASLCSEPTEVGRSHVDELRAAGVDDEGIFKLAELNVHFQFINRVADAFDFEVPVGEQKAAMAKLLNFAGRMSGGKRKQAAIRCNDGRLRVPELEAQRQKMLTQGIELDPAYARRVVDFVTRCRREVGEIPREGLSEPVAIYLEKLARYAYRISDEEFEAAKAERGSVEFIYELTLLGCYAASSVGVEELYEHLDLGI